jgi:tetratricopeptide (TPR) repeat protein
MYNLLISLAAAVGAFLLFFVPFHLRVGAALLPALIAGPAAYVLLARRTMKQMEVLMLAGQRELEAKRIEPGLAKIREAFPLGRWQFLIAPQVHAALGQYLYIFERYDEAKPHLEKSFVRIGNARAMLGALYFKRNNYPAMTVAFEDAVKHNKKDSLVWSTYAWCLERAGQRPKAVEVMGRALQESPSDEKLKANQLALQNNERMKMKPYGQMWWIFRLEPPPMDHIPPSMRGQVQQRKGYRQPRQR